MTVSKLFFFSLFPLVPQVTPNRQPDICNDYGTTFATDASWRIWHFSMRMPHLDPFNAIMHVFQSGFCDLINGERNKTLAVGQPG